MELQNTLGFHPTYSSSSIFIDPDKASEDWEKDKRGVDLISTINLLLKKVKDLEETNLKLKEQIEELYYAPGGPGYIMSLNDFENAKKRKK